VARGRTTRQARARRATLLLRWSLLATALLVAFLYYRPLSSYVETRSSLNERAAEVEALRSEKRRLEQRLADTNTVQALAREARRLGLVRPGERLYIVKGVQQWRRAEAARRARATIDGDG
jgi:cell division protein FtsB